MILLGSAARETRGNDYFEKMVSEAINWTREAKKKTEIDSKDDNKKTLSEYGLNGWRDEQSIETSEWFKKITQNIRTPEGAKDMAVALKRIKTFGESSASNNDIMYLKYFKYMMKKDSRRLPKNVVNLYGKIFK